MVIIGARRDVIGEALTDVIEYSPNVWAHARAMKYWQRMSAVDADTAKKLLATIAPEKWHWIGSFDLPSATVLNHAHTEIFNDSTGKSMVKFLKSEAGRRFRVPGNKAAPI